MIKLKQILLEGRMLTLYRGINAGNKNGRYYTTNPEWARQFTQSGLDAEILQVQIDPSTIYRPNPLPEATDAAQVDSAIDEAVRNGYIAVWMNEGHNEPNSVYVIHKWNLKNPTKYKSPVTEEADEDETKRQAWRQSWLERHQAKFDDKGRVIAYHGTPTKNIPSIKKNGFRPHSYFSLRPEYSKSIASRYHDTAEKNVTVLEVHLPLNLIDFVASDIYSTDTIPFKDTQ